MKILFLQKRILFPPDTGGKIRTLNVLRYLAQWHDVTYLCNAQPEDEGHLDSMRELGLRLETLPWRETPRNRLRFYVQVAANLFSPWPFNVDKNYDPALRQRAAELLAAEPFDLLICDFVQMARNAVGLNADASLLFQHNVEAQIFQRHFETGRRWLRRRYMHHQWRKMERFECRAGAQFDRVIAVSPVDRETFERRYNWRHVDVIDTAVDVDYFTPAKAEEKPDCVVFLGSMDWLPNEDGVQYFAEAIWPRILRERPRAEFRVVGRNPTAAVRRLQRVSGVEVVGTVDDVRPYLAGAAVVVVPLRIGGGTRLKIFEAMAMGKAVVSTPLGAEGLPVRGGEHLLLAERADDFALAVVGLLEDSARRANMGTAAREMVAANYSAERVARQFEATCLRTVDAASRAGENSAVQSAARANGSAQQVSS